MINLKDKNYLILGVANEKSIAWGIAQALHNCGANLCFTYVNESIEKRVRPLAKSLKETKEEFVLPCDVQDQNQIEKLFATLAENWGRIDGIVHSLAFAPKEELQNKFYDTSRTGFLTALDISAYSLITLCNHALPLMKENGGTVITLTYIGSQKVIPNYNVMGVAKAALECSLKYLASELGEFNIRINGISAGPIKTLAASGIPKFRDLLGTFSNVSPLRRNVSVEDVANTALFYSSPLSSGITGEITYVDCGFNIIGMSQEEKAS
jgi:enoyl-[acyl-carrier protein] reductase I